MTTAFALIWRGLLLVLFMPPAWIAIQDGRPSGYVVAGLLALVTLRPLPMGAGAKDNAVTD